MKRNTKIGAAVGATVLVLAVAALSTASSGGEAVAVRTAQVTRRPLVATVTANGWIRPRLSVDVQAAIMGRVVELAVDEGEHVAEGELLLRIDPTQYQAAVARAQAAVSEAKARSAQARAALIRAQLAFERQQALRERDSTLVSAQAFEEARAQLEIQQALHEAAGYGVEQAEAALRETRDRLSKTVIRSPIDGVVTRLNVEEGETAIVGTMNNPGSLLLTVSDLSVMEAVVQVDETDVPTLEPGDSAAVRIDAFPNRSFVGRVTEIGHSAIRSPATLARTGQQVQAVDFEVVITLDDPPETLRPDLSATADIVTAMRDSALAIPIIALTVRERPTVDSIPLENPAAQAAAAAATGEDEDREGVFVVEDGTARFVPVDVGIGGREHFEIVAGLAEGDTVVAGPYDAIRSLEDGDRVRPREQSGEAAGE